MFNRAQRAGLVLSVMALVGAACGGEATVTAEPANGAAEESGDASATPGLLGGDSAEASDTAEASSVPSEAPVVEISKDGTVVSDDSGIVSGNISTAGQLDTYTFEATDDQTIYLVETGGCSISGGDSLAYEFKGAASTNGDFVDIGDDIDCDDIASVRTDSSGTVQLTIAPELGFYGDSLALGEYSFRVIIVSDPTPVPLTIGDTVSPDSPQIGAGSIEHIGQTDLYTFPVDEGVAYEIVGQGGCQVENGDEFSFDLDGVSRDWIDGLSYFDQQSADGDCDDTYLFLAEESGTARMEVRGEFARTTGTYSFLVREADPSQLPEEEEVVEDVAEEVVEDVAEPADDGAEEQAEEADREPIEDALGE